MQIHDHFDGSMHCVECGGRCTLEGDERIVTELVRWTLGFAEVAHNGWMWDSTRDTLKKLVGPIRFGELQARAKDANKVRE